MPAPKHNEYYKKRRRHGRKRKYAGPGDLAKKATEYFDSADRKAATPCAHFSYSRADFRRFAEISPATYDRLLRDPLFSNVMAALNTCFASRSREGF